MKKVATLFIVVAMAFNAQTVFGNDNVQQAPDQPHGHCLVFYQENEMKFHTAHLYWHYRKWPGHRRFYSVIKEPRAEGVHKTQADAAIGDIVPSGEAQHPGTVRDEKIPAFLDHTEDGEDVSVYYLPAEEGPKEGKLTSAVKAMGCTHAILEPKLIGSVPSISLTDLEPYAGQIKHSDGWNTKGLMGPTVKDGGRPKRDEIPLGEDIRTKRNLLQYLQRRGQESNNDQNEPAAI